MKFTDLRMIFIVMSAMLLTSCVNLSTFTEPEKSLTDTTAESLTPIQRKAQALQAMPNRYKTYTSDHEFNEQTLAQFQGALLLKQQGHMSQAWDRLITLSEQHPNLSGIWLQLALLVKQQDKEDIQQKRQDMAKYLNIAITSNPLNYLAHNELAMLLRQQGHFQQALRHYELALNSWPAFAQGYVNRGILYDLYLGKKSLALADYQLYKALTNDDSRQLKGWIFDLQRQIKNTPEITQTGVGL